MRKQRSNTLGFSLSKTTKTNLIWALCYCCIFLLIYTAYAKLDDHYRFYKGLLKIPYIGNYALAISWLVPLGELFIALLLLNTKLQRWGLYLFIAMMGVFTLYIGSMLLWANQLPCNCGGAIEKLSWNQHLWFNLGFMAFALWALWLSKTSK
ncbi:MAG: hypothetical protein EON51_17630 [Acinetobacter sp.]|nr:MAG: hypothetical protein EON51_17630 [Acinetobacter sp.]